MGCQLIFIVVKGLYMKCSEFFLALKDYCFPMDYNLAPYFADTTLLTITKCMLVVWRQSKTASPEISDFDLAARELNLDESSIDNIQNIENRDNRYIDLVNVKLACKEAHGALASTLKINDSFLRNCQLIYIIKSTNDVQLAEDAADKIDRISVKAFAYLDVWKKNTTDDARTKKLIKKLHEATAIFKRQQMIGQNLSLLLLSSVIPVYGLRLGWFSRLYGA